MDIRNERGNPVDTQNLEYPEQQIAAEYIEENDVVLELGARYGSVSCVINSKLKTKTNHVAVEPDETVWIALERNKKANHCEFHIVKGFVSRKKLGLVYCDEFEGYATSSIEKDDSQIPSFPLEEIETKYNLQFNTLFADCEGFLGVFLEENPTLLDRLSKVIFEADFPTKCDYEKIRDSLTEKGFTCVHHTENSFHSVWIKNPSTSV